MLRVHAAEALARRLPLQHLGQVRFWVLPAAVLAVPPVEGVCCRHHGSCLVLMRVTVAVVQETLYLALMKKKKQLSH